MKKEIHEDYLKFFEQPTRESLRDLIKNNIGELNNLDFKKEWIEDSKLAKHILGISNSGGGIIVLGLNENSDGTIGSEGLDNITDKAQIMDGIKKYIPNQLEYEIINFDYTESENTNLKGKMFQAVLIDSDPKYIPFISKQNGVNISNNSIYIREGTRTIQASYEDIQRIINQRIETGYLAKSVLSIKDHLSQLRELYNELEDLNVTMSLFGHTYHLSRDPMEKYIGTLLFFIRNKEKMIEDILAKP